LIGKTFSKNSERKWFRRVETIIKSMEIAFCPSAGRESLWTTGEKVGFSKGPL
jgi:hypothetical protein